MLAKALRKYVNLKTVKKFHCLRFLDSIKYSLSSIVISVALPLGLQSGLGLIGKDLMCEKTNKEKFLMEGILEFIPSWKRLFGKKNRPPYELKYSHILRVLLLLQSGTLSFRLL